MKKFSLVIICFIIFISCTFAGCSTFSVDYVKYYNETVAKVYDDEISRFELLNAYNSYGYSYYVSQQGKSNDEALASTLDLMINRKLLVKHSKSDDKFALNDYDVNKLYQKVIDYLDDMFEGYKTQARKMLDIEEPKSSTDSEDSEKSFVIKDYEYESKRRAVLNSLNGIQYHNVEEEVIDSWALDEEYVVNFNSKTVNEIVTKLYAKFILNASENKNNEQNYSLIYDKAMSLMAKYLISYEYYLRDDNGKSYSTDTTSLIKRLVKRVYENELENSYIENIEDWYLENQVLSVDKLIKKYVELTETDYAKYKNSTTDYYNYLKTIGTSGDVIYYTPENAEGNFNYFLHVLLPLDETVVQEIKNARESTEYDEIGLKNEINRIISGQTHTPRDENSGKLIKVEDVETGELVDKKVSITSILQEYSNNVATLNDFMTFMFKYTSDTATLTANMPYVIGYESDKTYSSMVTEFTDEAVRLMKNDLTMTSANDFIITQYGIHLLYRLGNVEAKFKYEDRNKVVISFDRNVENNLYYTILNDLTGRTYFDMLFDLVYPASDGSIYTSNNGYSEYEDKVVNTLKTENVVIYKTKLKATSKI